MALTVFDEGVDSGVEMANFRKSVYERSHGERDDVSLRRGEERREEKEKEYRIVDKDEFVEVILLGKGKVDVFTGYALKEIEGVA